MIYFVLIRNGHFPSVVSTLTDLVKLDVEKDNVVSTLPNFSRINVEIHNVDSMLSNVANSNIEMHNDDLRFYHVATSYQPKDNVEATLKCLLGNFKQLLEKYKWVSARQRLGSSFWVLLNSSFAQRDCFISLLLIFSQCDQCNWWCVCVCVCMFIFFHCEGFFRLRGWGLRPFSYWGEGGVVWCAPRGDDIYWYRISPKTLSLKSFGNSWGNSYIPCLEVIIAHRFTCGERKIW